ncbi:creatininase family protein [Clostridium estertheticum]|uniref:creatininase family protein n=1 Tax=Clostridium estertheticum TaxID=238834 RepID=UPI0013E9090E|nr:creatininase family protein [Clostridium estertheticum]MBZ9689557.1 creatininase family protein [Clostridium estertheticum]
MYIIEYTSDDFKKYSEKNHTIIIPIGSVEAHGHHLPLGTDIFSPRLFCEKINEKIGDKIWIAPEIPYGQSYDLSIYPGTVTMPSEVMAEYVYYVGKSFYENGLKNIIFFNGHGGNITALSLAAEKLVPLGATVMTINWWLDFSGDILTITEGQGHAGEDETSAILYYNEELVQMDKAMKNPNKQLIPVRFVDRGKTIFQDALTGDATLATVEKGERIFKLLEKNIIERIEIMQQGMYY